MELTNFKTLAAFMAYFKDEETCRLYFEKIRFRNGSYCPHCAHKDVYRFNDGKRFRCAQCKKDFTIKTGTVFGESKISIQKWFVAIYLLSVNKKGISSVQLANQVGVTQKTAWFMDHRIRHSMKQNGGKLFGIIEADETYVGGKERNKHFDKRIEGTQGRNTKTKAVVMGLLQRGGMVKANVVNDVRMMTVESQIVNNVKLGSTLYTDDFNSYSRIGKFFPHEVVHHSKGQYVRDGNIHSNGMESFWAMFKRGYYGIYHQMSKKHLQKYIDEFAFRYKHKESELVETFSDVVERVSTNVQLPYKVLTGKI